MTKYHRIRRKFLLREAEGYLELLSLEEHGLSLNVESRRPILERVLSQLGSLERTARFDADTLVLRGEALRQLERFDEAVGYLRRAVELAPDNVSVYLALGWCYKRTERLDLAIEALESAMLVDSEEPTLHYNLACYWSLAKNVKLAVRFLSSAIDLEESFRDLATRESDFDAIRDSADFAAALSTVAVSRSAD